jgi:hypothetical protein
MNRRLKFLSRAMTITRTVLLSALLPLSSIASQIQITVTGVVGSGVDDSGVFGPQNGDIATEPFSLVFTFDDTKGMQAVETCGGIPYFVSITNTGSSNPGTATLTIGSGSFTFGVLNASYGASSEAEKSCSDAQISLAAGDGYYGDGSGLDGSVSAAPDTTFGTDPSWDAPFSDSNLYANPASDATLSFEITEFGSTDQEGSGDLIPQSITVSGPEVSSAPESGTGGLLIVGILLMGVPRLCTKKPGSRELV